MSKKMDARVSFFPPDKGGFIHPPLSGVKPQLKVGNMYTSCVIVPITGEKVMDFGKEYHVEIDIIFWDECKHLFQNNVVELYNGNKFVGKGYFVGDILSR